MPSTQNGGEWISLAPEVSLAGVPRGSQEGVNTVVVSNGGLDVRSGGGASERRMSDGRASGTMLVGIPKPA